MNDIASEGTLHGAVAAVLGTAVALALVACSAPGSEPTATVAPTEAAADGSGGGLVASPRGRAEGFVVDPAANNPISAIQLQLVRTDTGAAVDAGMSGTDGSYALDVPTDDKVPDGTLLQVRTLLPADHVYAYSYATPTAFPAGIGGTLPHNILLTGP